jgi:hypothetical protein
MLPAFKKTMRKRAWIMKLEALDNFYTDETKQVLAGRTFAVASPETGKDLIKAGLAQEVEEEEADASDTGETGEASATKATAAPQNKAKAAPATK